MQNVPNNKKSRKTQVVCHRHTHDMVVPFRQYFFRHFNHWTPPCYTSFPEETHSLFAAVDLITRPPHHRVGSTGEKNTIIMNRAGERERLLPRRNEDHRNREEGGRQNLLRHHHRPYGGLPAGLGDAVRVDRRRSFLSAFSHVTRIALVASALVVSATILSNLARPSSARGLARSSASESAAGLSSREKSVRETAVLSQNSEKVGGNAAAGDSAANMGTDVSALAAVEPGASASGGPKNDTGSTGQPNVILILIDDAGMNDIGHQSTDLGELTPFMDSLSSQGVRLSKYYTNHLCTPARVSTT